MPMLETEDIGSREGSVTFLPGDDRSFDDEAPDRLVGVHSMKRVAFEKFSPKIAVREWEVP